MSGRVSAAHVADFLSQGLLDVLVDLFRSDTSLYALLGELLADPRLPVRLGTSALVEELAQVDPERRPLAAAALSLLLGASNPVHRGDAAYLLGFVGGASELATLARVAAEDENADVREVAAEAAGRVRASRLSRRD